MGTRSVTFKENESTSTGVEFAVAKILPISIESLATLPPPPVPNLLVDRKDLARLFGKNSQTPKRWERWGWIKAERKSNGRIKGYDAVTVASLAARLFLRFKRAEFSREEACRLGLDALLDWVLKTVRAGVNTEGPKSVPVVDLLGLAALAEAADVLPASWAVSEPQLHDHLLLARQQMILRLRHPDAQRILVEAWRESGVIAAVHKVTSVSSVPRKQSYAQHNILAERN